MNVGFYIQCRNLHSHISTEYDGESRELFHCLERIQLKMADFQNHRHFTLRCLGEEVVPVSIKLKSQVKTPKVSLNNLSPVEDKT